MLHFLTLFDKIQGGSDEWVWGVKSHIFGICQKVFFRHKNENGFLSKLRGGEGVRAILTFVKIFLVFFFEGFPYNKLFTWVNYEDCWNYKVEMSKD